MERNKRGEENKTKGVKRGGQEETWRGEEQQWQEVTAMVRTKEKGAVGGLRVAKDIKDVPSKVEEPFYNSGKLSNNRGCVNDNLRIPRGARYKTDMPDSGQGAVEAMLYLIIACCKALSPLLRLQCLFQVCRRK